MKKFFALFLALILAFTFVACNRGGGDDETEPVDTTLETTPEETSDEDATEPEETTEPGEAGVPEDMSGIIDYYNKALAKSSLQRASYKRTLTKVTAYALKVIDEQNLQDDENIQAIGNVDEKKNEPSDLVALKEEWVEKAEISVTDGVATLAITMKNHDLDAALESKPGDRGYVSTLDKNTIIELVIESAMILAGGLLKSTEVDACSLGMTDGKYVVTVDTATGEITGVTFTFSQFADGKAKCRVDMPLVSLLPVPANVTLRGDMAAAYAPK